MVLLVVAILNPDRWYTFITFLLVAVLLTLHFFTIKAPYLGRFYVIYFVTLIRFFIVNGALTGMFWNRPVVWYDDSRNQSPRLGTIPIEDTVYGLFMLLVNTTIYEWLRGRENKIRKPEVPAS